MNLPLSVTPAFVLDLQTALWWGWVALAVLVASGTLFWLYRRLYRLYPRKQASALLILKTAAAALLLLGLLRPVLIQEKKDLTNSRVILLVDDSRSMSTHDGTLGAPRIDDARQLAFEKILPQLRKHLPVTVLAFDGRVRGLESPEALRAAGESTDIPNALLESAKQYGASGRVGAYVLLTDGGDARALPPAFSAGVPIFALALGSDLAHSDDLRIERVEHPGRVDAKTEFEVKVEVAASGGQAFFRALGPLSLSLTEGKKPVAAQAVRLSHGTPRRRLTFRVQAPEPGIHRYTLKLPSFKTEVATLNNTRTFTLEVENPSLRILYYASKLGQGYKAFRNAVKSDPGIQFSGLVRLGADRFLLQGKRAGDRFGNKFPSTQEALRKFKIIVLAGCEARDVPPRAGGALKQYVSDGGALVLLGGPRAYGRGGWADTALRPLFPWAIAPSEPPFRREKSGVELTPLGRAHPIFRDLAKALHSGGNAFQVKGYNKPGALRPGAQALMQLQLPSGERPALIALGHYGKGKVLGLASNGLWRWSQAGSAGQRVYDAFWRQAVRYLAGREGGGGSLLKLSADRQGSYRPGARATISARVLDRALKPLSGATLNATLKRMDGSVIRAVPFGEAGSPGAYAAQVDLAAKGTYRLQVSASDAKGLLETRELLLEVGAGSGEGAHLAVNRSYLEALAAKSGGAALDAKHAEEAVAMVLKGVKAEVQRKETSLLWDTPFFFLLYLGLMTAEWVARRKMNLV